MATQQTAETRYIIAEGTRLAYRRLGCDSGTPLVMHMHFRGNMDFWDPALINALAKSRPIILFDNAGVGRSEGEIPPTFQGWAAHVVALLKALRIEKIDLLGFSMGGMAAQCVYLQAPNLIRKLILAGTCTSGNPNFVDADYSIYLGLANSVTEQDFYAGWARSFFYNTPHGQAAAQASWQRIFSRTQERAPQLSPELAKRQAQARAAFRKPHPENPYERIAEFTIPVFVANGDDDRLIPTKNSVQLAELLPDAHLHIYPNSGHGFLFQYAELFAKHIDLFLDGYDGVLDSENMKVLAKLA